MIRLWTLFQTRAELGATMVEYGIVVALIAAVSILVIGFLGVDVFDAFQTAETNIDGVTGG
jgi:pilus assembly protein Flp/PilA